MRTCEDVHVRTFSHVVIDAIMYMRLVYTCDMTHSCVWFSLYRQTGEIGLDIITTAKISTSFHGSPFNFPTSFHGSPENVRQVFTGVKRESPSLQRLDRKTFQSGDTKIPSLISSVSGCEDVDIGKCSHVVIGGIMYSLLHSVIACGYLILPSNAHDVARYMSACCDWRHHV